MTPMQTAESASPIPGPAPFAADLPPVPAPITAPIDPADVHDAEVQLLRAIVESQKKALIAAISSKDTYLPEHVADQIAAALTDSELAR